MATMGRNFKRTGRSFITLSEIGFKSLREAVIALKVR